MLGRMHDAYHPTDPDQTTLIRDPRQGVDVSTYQSDAFPDSDDEGARSESQSLPTQHRAPSRMYPGRSTVSASSSYFVTVIPPPDLPVEALPRNTSVRSLARRGTLLPLYPTLGGQLYAIAREYGLPSVGGISLYLVDDGQGGDGPRIGDSTWATLWSSFFEEEDMDDVNASMDVFDTDSSTRMPSLTYHRRGNPSPRSRQGTPSRRLPRVASQMSLGSTRSTPGRASFSFEAGRLPIVARLEWAVDPLRAKWWRPFLAHAEAVAESSVSNKSSDAPPLPAPKTGGPRPLHLASHVISPSSSRVLPPPPSGAPPKPRSTSYIYMPPEPASGVSPENDMVPQDAPVNLRDAPIIEPTSQVSESAPTSSAPDMATAPTTPAADRPLYDQHEWATEPLPSETGSVVIRTPPQQQFSHDAFSSSSPASPASPQVPPPPPPRPSSKQRHLDYDQPMDDNRRLESNERPSTHNHDTIDAHEDDHRDVVNHGHSKGVDSELHDKQDKKHDAAPEAEPKRDRHTMSSTVASLSAAASRLFGSHKSNEPSKPRTPPSPELDVEEARDRLTEQERKSALARRHKHRASIDVPRSVKRASARMNEVMESQDPDNELMTTDEKARGHRRSTSTPHVPPNDWHSRPMPLPPPLMMTSASRPNQPAEQPNSMLEEPPMPALNTLAMPSDVADVAPKRGAIDRVRHRSNASLRSPIMLGNSLPEPESTSLSSDKSSPWPSAPTSASLSAPASEPAPTAGLPHQEHASIEAPSAVQLSRQDSIDFNNTLGDLQRALELLSPRSDAHRRPFVSGVRRNLMAERSMMSDTIREQPDSPVPIASRAALSTHSSHTDDLLNLKDSPDLGSMDAPAQFSSAPVPSGHVRSSSHASASAPLGTSLSWTSSGTTPMGPADSAAPPAPPAPPAVALQLDEPPADPKGSNDMQRSSTIDVAHRQPAVDQSVWGLPNGEAPAWSAEQTPLTSALAQWGHGPRPAWQASSDGWPQDNISFASHPAPPQMRDSYPLHDPWPHDVMASSTEPLQIRDSQSFAPRRLEAPAWEENSWAQAAPQARASDVPSSRVLTPPESAAPLPEHPPVRIPQNSTPPVPTQLVPAQQPLLSKLGALDVSIPPHDGAWSVRWDLPPNGPPQPPPKDEHELSQTQWLSNPDDATTQLESVLQRMQPSGPVQPPPVAVDDDWARWTDKAAASKPAVSSSTSEPQPQVTGVHQNADVPVMPNSSLPASDGQMPQELGRKERASTAMPMLGPAAMTSPESSINSVPTHAPPLAPDAESSGPSVPGPLHVQGRMTPPNHEPMPISSMSPMSPNLQLNGNQLAPDAQASAELSHEHNGVLNSPSRHFFSKMSPKFKWPRRRKEEKPQQQQHLSPSMSEEDLSLLDRSRASANSLSTLSRGAAGRPHMRSIEPQSLLIETPPVMAPELATTAPRRQAPSQGFFGSPASHNDESFDGPPPFQNSSGAVLPTSSSWGAHDPLHPPHFMPSKVGTSFDESRMMGTSSGRPSFTNANTNKDLMMSQAPSPPTAGSQLRNDIPDAETSLPHSPQMNMMHTGERDLQDLSNKSLSKEKSSQGMRSLFRRS